MEGFVVSGSNNIAEISGSLNVTGSINLTGSLNVTGSGRFNDTLTIEKPASISSLIVKNNSSTTGLWLYLNGLDATLSNQDNGKLSLQSNGTTAVEINQLAASNFIGAVTASQTLTATKAAIGSTTTPTIPLEVYGQQKWYTTTGDGSELRGFFNPGGAADASQLTFYKADGVTSGVKITPDGVDFSATTDGTGTVTWEVLNDYEEGTWTGTMTGTVSNPTTPVTATGYYTKIGRQVTISIVFSNVDTTGASGGVRITGVPFATAYTGGIGSVILENFDFTGTKTSVASYMNAGTPTTIFIEASGDETTFGGVAHSAGTGRYLYTTLTYFT
jgi:hypothetical protein